TMPSISFDPVAHAYDTTRGYPPGIEQGIASSLEQAAQATEQTAFIEVGVGTGRIALPLASLGHTYTGVDISEKMLAQLESKVLTQNWEEYEQPWGSRADETSAPAHQVRRFARVDPAASLRLVTSDITALPFPDASFDAAVAVHIFHLVDGWQQAVRESLRVLRPGGFLLHCWDEHDDTSLDIVIETWIKLVEELGGSAHRVGPESPRMVSTWLREQGLPVEELSLARWETIATPRRALQRITSRLWSRTWLVPDEIFQTSVQRLEAWALNYFGAEHMDTPHTRVNQFIVQRTQITEGS
ncbi:MAG TPA: class I SAM-dependent methyltransferase, partial [Ktedonobacteraceae bacterium]|nr:class I SAM-dependent methyltransferase [Ktedonobacteraceae bacterium]